MTDERTANTIYRAYKLFDIFLHELLRYVQRTCAVSRLLCNATK